MRKYFRTISAVVAASMLLAAPMTALATDDGIVDDGAVIETEEESSEEVSEEISSEEDSIDYENMKPFLALGANLSDAQLDTVLTEMGISRDELDDYTVIYITNEMEHEYLDGYIDSSVIGKNALSCVRIKLTGEKTGIRVTTKNINYCTTNMYRNALITAGVEDADVLVVGPMQISGTAALIGAMKAYEAMTGTTLDEDAQDTAMNELVAIGEITDGLSEEEASQVQALFDYVKAEVIANDITDIDDIKKLIEEAEEKFSVTLDSDKIDIIANLMSKIGELDIDPAKLLEQAGDLYDKYGETILKDAKDLIDSVITEDVKKNFFQAIGDFFSNLWDSIMNLFNF